MDNEAEVIKHQMRETRSSLTEKVEALEESLAAKIKDTTETVAQTVHSVADVVDQTSNVVSESVASVKDAVSMKRHFDEHPWLFLAGGAALGYLGGCLMGGRSSTESPGQHFGARGYGSQPQQDGRDGRDREEQRREPPQRKEESGPSWLGTLTEAFAPAVSKLEGMALDATTNMVGTMILNAVPEELRKDARDVLNEVTKALGVKPVPMPPPQEQACPSPATQLAREAQGAQGAGSIRTGPPNGNPATHATRRF